MLQHTQLGIDDTLQAKGIKLLGANDGQFLVLHHLLWRYTFVILKLSTIHILEVERTDEVVAFGSLLIDKEHTRIDIVAHNLRQLGERIHNATVGIHIAI